MKNIRKRGRPTPKMYVRASMLLAIILMWMTAPLQGRDKSSLIRAELAWHQLTKNCYFSSLIIVTSSQAMYSVAVCFKTRVTTEFFFLSLFSFLLFAAKSRAKWFWSIKFGQIIKEHDRLRNLIARVSRDQTDPLRDQILYRKSRLNFSGVRRYLFYTRMVIFIFDYGNRLRLCSQTVFLSRFLYLKFRFWETWFSCKNSLFFTTFYLKTGQKFMRTK